jgi:hypothetical protein
VNKRTKRASANHLLDYPTSAPVQISRIVPYKSHDSPSESQQRFHTFQENHAGKVIIVAYTEKEDMFRGNF